MNRDDRRGRDTVETIKGDTNDALDEMKERPKAGGEKMKRAAEGDRMPLGERVEKTRRDVRDEEA